MKTNENGMKVLEVGDEFKVECYKSAPSKKFPDKMNAKILTTEGDIVFTSAAQIVKIFDGLTNDKELVNLHEYTFKIVKAGEFNGYPILSADSDNPEVKKKIRQILF